MKVALLTPTFYKYSGIDRVVAHQARELAEAGHQVTILAFKADRQPTHSTLELVRSPRAIVLERVQRLFLPLDLVNTWHIVQRLKSFDQVISHHYPMNWPALLAKRFWGCRYVYYNHGIAPAELFTRLSERAYMRLFHHLARRTIRGADHVISVSAYLRDELRRQLGLDSEVRHNKIDPARLRPPPLADDAPLRQALQGPGVVFTIGRVVPYKGLHLLLAAFRLAHQERPDLRLIVAGDLSRFAGYYEGLTQTAGAAVTFLGYISDAELALCYAHCDVYATASLWEGFDLPAVEAQTLGKPVAAFDVGSHHEVIQDGETGLLVRPRDVPELARAILHTLERKEQLGQRAQVWARRFHPPDGPGAIGRTERREPR